MSHTRIILIRILLRHHWFPAGLRSRPTFGRLRLKKGGSGSATLISSYILKLFFGLGSVHRERGQEVALWWHLHTAKVSRRIKCNCTILYSRILIIFYVFFSYLFSHEKLCRKLSSLPTTSIIHNLSKIYNILVTTIIVYQYCKLRNPSLE